MKQIIFLTGFHLCFWGFLGFLATLLFGFIACCAGFSADIFFASLMIFAATGITVSAICISRRCKKLI